MIPLVGALLVVGGLSAYVLLGDGGEPAIATDAAGNPIVCAAGDIAATGFGDDETARLLSPCDHVITLGDNAYQSGTLSEFQTRYDPSWGVAAKPRTHPSVGNHEYKTRNAQGYKDYFGAAAQPAGTTYYAWSPPEQPSWLMIAWDSNCAVLPGAKKNGCAPGSPQHTWLSGVLASNTKPCVLIYSHHPRWSIGRYAPGVGSARPLWDLATQYNVDLVLNGHDHNYQRWAQLDAAGNPSVTGTREVINGEGGASHYPFSAASPNVEASHAGTFGVVSLVLEPNSYTGEFVPIAGGAFTDRFSAGCNP